MEINIKLDLEQLEMLNNFIENSTPTIKFKEATRFIATLQLQIKQELENQNKEK